MDKILGRLKIVDNPEKLLDDFFVFDCETFSRDARPEGFAFCCMTGRNYRKVFHTIEDFKQEIFSGRFSKKHIFCHWAEFDLNVIFGNIKINLDRQSIFNGSTFICAQKHNVSFADSLNIYKTSVKEIGSQLGFEKLELPQKFGQGKKVAITKEDIEYCYRDCDIVFQALSKIFLEVQSIRPTLAGLAMIYYRRFYQPFDFMYNELSMKFFDSYYGGRVEAFKIGKTYSYKYDINSMYPFAMVKVKFPNPKHVKKSKANDLEGLLHTMKFYEGQATITVNHKYHEFGFLPVRSEGKLKFPSGTFTGTWCFPEIRFALKHKIIDIVEIHEVLRSHRMDSPFKNFANDLYEARLTVTGIEKVIKKNLMNSLYGKFGQRQKFLEIYYEEVPFELLEILIDRKIPYELKMFNKDRNDCYIRIFKPVKITEKEVKERNIKILSENEIEIEDTDNYSIEYKVNDNPKAFKTKIHSIPCFASYITSYARVYLLEQMIKYKKNNVTYCDTDCVCMEIDPMIEDSLVLGAFKKEKEILTHIYGNKNYTEIKGDVLNRKIKGIPKKAVKLSENSFLYQAMTKTKKAIRNQLTAGVWVEQEKTITNRYDKRKVLKSGKTKILKIKQAIVNK